VAGDRRRPGRGGRGAGHPHAQHRSPGHGRLRRLVSKAFTARRIERLRPRVTEITASLLDAMPDRGEADLLQAFAFPLPITVICELLGVPCRDRDEFRAWTQAILSHGGIPEAPGAAAMAMAGYFTALVADKRAHPAGDLLSALLAARDSGDRLTGSELLGMLFLLLVAGHETTVNLIGSGTLALRTVTRPRTRSTSGVTPAGTWRSATASTTASARRWPGWKARSRPCLRRGSPPDRHDGRRCVPLAGFSFARAELAVRRFGARAG